MLTLFTPGRLPDPAGGETHSADAEHQLQSIQSLLLASFPIILGLLQQVGALSFHQKFIVVPDSVLPARHHSAPAQGSLPVSRLPSWNTAVTWRFRLVFVSDFCAE